MLDREGVLMNFASERYAAKLGEMRQGRIDSDEPYPIFRDFYHVVGPTNVRRFRALPKELDVRLRSLDALASTAIRHQAGRRTMMMKVSISSNRTII